MTYETLQPATSCSLKLTTVLFIQKKNSYGNKIQETEVTELQLNIRVTL